MPRAEDLRTKAAHYRQLATEARHPESRDALLLLADEYEIEAAALENAQPEPPTLTPEPPPGA